MADEQDLYHREKPLLSLEYYSITRQRLQLVPHPVGKSYVSIVEAEKTAFEQGRKHRQNGHKKPATSILATFADKGRRRQLMRKY